MTPPDPELVAALAARCIEDPEIVATVMEGQGLGITDLSPMPLPDDPCDLPD